MSVKKNLIAAKALIDTPETFRLLSPDAALDQVTGPRTFARKKAYEAIRAAKPEDWVATDWGRFDRVMLRFDRAIAAADDA